MVNNGAVPILDEPMFYVFIDVYAKDLPEEALDDFYIIQDHDEVGGATWESTAGWD